MDYLTEMMDCVRSKHPLVHHITNYVTVNDCANICICSGGSPVMTDEMKERFFKDNLNVDVLSPS